MPKVSLSIQTEAAQAAFLLPVLRKICPPVPFFFCQISRSAPPMLYPSKKLTTCFYLGCVVTY